MFSNSKLFLFPFVVVAAPFVAGCSGHVDTVLVGEIEQGLDAAMYGPEDPAGESAIRTNSLEPSALQPTDIGRHRLRLESMSSATAALLTGPEGTQIRALLKYAVGCALDADELFAFSWTDENGVTHQESYLGSLGLAPDWLSRPLNLPEQEWVSACLASKANWYGERVEISMRGGRAELDVDDPEFEMFPMREGAFWGNLFSTTPYLRACYDSDNIDYSRMARRECATGHLGSGATVAECGMIVIVGSCQQTCLAPSADGYYSSCAAHREGMPSHVQTHRMITPFLQ